MFTLDDHSIFLDPCIANHPVICPVARQGHDALCGRIDPSKGHMGHEPPFHGKFNVYPLDFLHNHGK